MWHRYFIFLWDKEQFDSTSLYVARTFSQALWDKELLDSTCISMHKTDKIKGKQVGLKYICGR